MRYYFLLSCWILLLFSACGNIKDPVFNSIQNVEVSKPGLDHSLMSFDMEYFNPNGTKALLKEAEGHAWLDSVYLGHFRVGTVVSIPANANFIVPVKLDVEMKNMLKHSMAAFLNEYVLVTIKGTAKVGKGGFYRRFAINYEGKQDIRKLFKK